MSHKELLKKALISLEETEGNEELCEEIKRSLLSQNIKHDIMLTDWNSSSNEFDRKNNIYQQYHADIEVQDQSIFITLENLDKDSFGLEAFIEINDSKPVIHVGSIVGGDSEAHIKAIHTGIEVTPEDINDQAVKYEFSNREDDLYDDDKVLWKVSEGKDVEKFDPYFKNHHGRTVLHAAAINGDSNQIQKLINAGVEIDAKDNYGNTPLLIAVEFYNKAATTTLVENGADITIKNTNGDNAIEISKKNCSEEITAALEQAYLKISTEKMKKLKNKPRTRLS